MQFDRSKLSGRITQVFGSQRRFAEAAGLTESSVSNKLNGKTKISDEEICRWSSADLLDIPAEQIGEFFCTPKFHF